LISLVRVPGFRARGRSPRPGMTVFLHSSQIAARKRRLLFRPRYDSSGQCAHSTSGCTTCRRTGRSVLSGDYRFLKSIPPAQEFPDNHTGVGYRMDESLPFLAQALSS